MNPSPIISATDYAPIDWMGFILGLLALWAGVSGGLAAFRRGFSKFAPKEGMSPEPESDPLEEWRTLCDRADHIVKEMQAQFPRDVALEAKQVPCLFKERADKESPGYRTLGHYHNFVPGRVSDHKGPIFLYLKTIEESCLERNEDFDAEVKRVYLHELGHHFGWDEVDLVRHGLPSGKPPDEV